MTAVLIVLAVFGAVFALLVLAGFVLAQRRAGPFATGSPDPRRIEQDVGADVAALNKDRDLFDPRGPGSDPDLL